MTVHPQTQPVAAPAPTCLRAVRAQIEQAQEHLTIACKVMRNNGFPESANDLSRNLKMLNVWTQQSGLLHWLEHGKDWPSETSQ